MFRLRSVRDVPARIWAIAGMFRGKKRTHFVSRFIKRYRREAAKLQSARTKTAHGAGRTAGMDKKAASPVWGRGARTPWRRHLA